MVKKHRHKKTKGGDLNSWWSNNVTNSNWLNRSKSYLPNWLTGDSSQSSNYYTGSTNMNYDTTGLNGSTNSTYPSGLNYGTTGSNYGGKRRTKRKHGGYRENTPTTGLATHAAPVSGLHTAKPHTWVGGKTKRGHRHSRTCKHRKH
jgi:hypothetical protein